MHKCVRTKFAQVLTGVIMARTKQSFPRIIRWGAALSVGVLGVVMVGFPSTGYAATKKSPTKRSTKVLVAKPIPLAATTTPPTIPAPLLPPPTIPAVVAPPAPPAPTNPTTTIRKVDQNLDFDITLLYPRPFIRLGQTASVGGEIVFRSNVSQRHL